VKIHTAAQGSPDWLQARLGVPTLFGSGSVEHDTDQWYAPSPLAAMAARRLAARARLGDGDASPPVDALRIYGPAPGKPDRRHEDEGFRRRSTDPENWVYRVPDLSARHGPAERWEPTIDPFAYETDMPEGYSRDPRPVGTIDTSLNWKKRRRWWKPWTW
jgi:hypothetical protein